MVIVCLVCARVILRIVDFVVQGDASWQHLGIHAAALLPGGIVDWCADYVYVRTIQHDVLPVMSMPQFAEMARGTIDISIECAIQFFMPQLPQRVLDNLRLEGNRLRLRVGLEQLLVNQIGVMFDVQEHPALGQICTIASWFGEYRSIQRHIFLFPGTLLCLVAAIFFTQPFSEMHQMRPAVFSNII